MVAELGQISRFETAPQLMGYSGAVPSEDSSGKIRRHRDRGTLDESASAASLPEKLSHPHLGCSSRLIPSAVFAITS